MIISILTLFPEMFEGIFAHSIIKHAGTKKLVKIEFVNIRDFGIGKHKTVDDAPYGGGVGMVMRIDVLHKAIKQTVEKHKMKNRRIILTSAKGETYTQAKARSFSKLDHLIIICGHYEGIDERILKFVDEEISIGNYILTGGEIPAMIITDSVTRLITGVLKPEATTNESFEVEQMLEHPHYTRPENYEGLSVPSILLSGNHQKIEEWRSQQTKTHRGGDKK